jgi:hypothetical protein
LRVQAKEHIIDIATISALGMHYNLRAESNEVFVTSLYEINRILQERREVELYNIDKETEDWEGAVKKVLPEEY